MSKNQPDAVAEEMIQVFLREVGRNGLAAVTVESITKEANVRVAKSWCQFPSVKELARHIIEALLNQLDATVPRPCSNLETDLKNLASEYWGFWQRYPGVLAFYMEAAKDKELRDLVVERQEQTRAKLIDFFAFYRREGCFAQELDELDDEELEHELAGAFLGSIYSRVHWQAMGIVKARFNVDRFVQLFLKGYGRGHFFI